MDDRYYISYLVHQIYKIIYLFIEKQLVRRIKKYKQYIYIYIYQVIKNKIKTCIKLYIKMILNRNVLTFMNNTRTFKIVAKLTVQYRKCPEMI